MADFNIRSDSVDVEQIMAQIRARIQEKRGVDYTEEQVRELATVRLEKFLDPKNVRSDLLEQFKRSRPALPEPPKDVPPVEPPYAFDDETIYQSHRAPLRWIRRLLNPILKLFFNPNPLIQVVHAQSQFNVDLLKRDQRRRIEMQDAIYAFERTRADWNVLYYEVLHNLVLETTRNGIELKNLKMRVEALASRLDFSERRVRALEGVVQYRPEIVRPRPAGPREAPARPPQFGRLRDEPDEATEAAASPARSEPVGTVPGDVAPGQPGESSGRRRRRRRRGRRGVTSLAGAGSESLEQTADQGGSDDDFENGDDSEGGADVPTVRDSSLDEGPPMTREPATIHESVGQTAATNTTEPDASRENGSRDEPRLPPSDPQAQ